MFYSPRNRGNMDRFYRFRSRSISAAQAPRPWWGRGSRGLEGHSIQIGRGSAQRRGMTSSGSAGLVVGPAPEAGVSGPDPDPCVSGRGFGHGAAGMGRRSGRHPLLQLEQPDLDRRDSPGGNRGRTHPPSVRRRNGDRCRGARRGAASGAPARERSRSAGGRLRPVHSGRPAAPFYRRRRSPGHSNHGSRLPIRPAGSGSFQQTLWA